MEGTKIRKNFTYYSELMKKPFPKAECNYTGNTTKQINKEIAQTPGSVNEDAPLQDLCYCAKAKSRNQ